LYALPLFLTPFGCAWILLDPMSQVWLLTGWARGPTFVIVIVIAKQAT
jgi:hypothetical protein